MSVRQRAEIAHYRQELPAPQISTDLEAPMRSAPAMMRRAAKSASRMPPAALTFMAVPTVSLINLTSSSVAPAVEKPVEVFTKCAPAAIAA